MIELSAHPYMLALTVMLGVVFTAREIVSFKSIVPLKYIFTPLVTLFIILICLLSFGSGPDRYRVFIIIGLLLSLIADVLLMIEEVDLMKYGIVFFLLAHVAYIAAFTGGYSFLPWHLVPALVLGAGITFLFIKIKGNTGGLDLPVLVYSMVIGLMVFFALALLNGGLTSRSMLASGGAVMFLVSDSIIAINAFVSEIPHATVLVWALYAPAQFLIALSCF